MQKEWKDLTRDEKREERLKRWLSPPDIQFSSQTAEKAFKERAVRLSNALLLKKPDRIPVTLAVGNFPAYYAGKSLYHMMYDYDELYRAWTKFLHDFADDMDGCDGPHLGHSGRVLDILGCKLYRWPGNGLANDVPSYQFVDDEYMMPDEYDSLIKDPSGFALRILIPRVLGALEPFKNLVPAASMLQMPLSFLAPAAMPDVRAAFRTIVNAGEEMARWQEVVGRFSREALAMGFRSIMGAGAIAPFDTIGNMLRGTRGIMIDMYRRPEKLIEAMEAITPLIIEGALNAINKSGGIMVTFALHKGNDAFMSIKQFETFYWPTLKKIVMALIDEGVMVGLYGEGRYTTRLEIVSDLPGGWVLWGLENTDMVKAKEILGDRACISGNVPSSLMCVGKPEAVKEYCRNLIELFGTGGGYILSSGGPVTEANPDNLRVLMETARQYGANIS